ncbi:hypothetical protein QYM36_009640 [Artemia franciscana]|uniref:Reverse transcriptase domain-containing protein n=1 Tax=Artemia franciscana TaxID=6661 RepID=A0AA88HZV6_ARTSF|nr:hypothetical protein QYM36_009640 [Artemia franciscana]
MAVKSKNPFNAINLEKPTTAIKQAKSRINVGCWNVRSVKQEATQAFLVHEMEKYNIDILCISETRISGSGSIVITAPETLHQFHFFYSGVEDNSGLHGVGFIMNQRTGNALLEWEPVSCRLAQIRLKGNPANVSTISTYAPTRDATETTKDDFYGKLQQLSPSVATHDYLIVSGDFNARVGPSDQTTRQILGKFGQGHRCENGQRGCTDNIFAFRFIIQQFERYNLPLILMFLDLIAAFDSVTRQKLWKILENDGMPLKFVDLMKAYYDASLSRVRVYGEETEEFLVEFGPKQGCVLSPTLFYFCIDWVLENALSSYPRAQIGQNLSLTDLDYADDVGLLSDPVEAQNMLDNVVAWANLIGLKVSTEKTKFMAFNHETGPFSLTINQVQLEKANHGAEWVLDGSYSYNFEVLGDLVPLGAHLMCLSQVIFAICSHLYIYTL